MTSQKTSNGPTHTQVLIAGAGPVGMTLAIDLGRRGISVIVVDKSPTTTTNPRCNTTNARSMEYFRRLGVSEPIRRSGLPLNHATDVVYCAGLTGPEFTRFEFSSSGAILDGSAHEFDDWPTPEPQHRVSQIFLEPVLEEHLKGTPNVELLRGWALESANQDDDRASAVIRNAESGEARIIYSEFLVGCDGGASTVRRSIGAKLEGDSDVSGQRRTVLFRSSELANSLGDRPGWMYWWFAPELRGSCIKLDGESLFLTHTRVPEGIDPETIDPDVVVRATMGSDLEYETLGVENWTARRLVANRFREGRIFLAGDAAHLWLPLGGFGMNTGIGDAMALSWRLAARLKGWGGARLLSDYQVERQSVGNATSQAAVTIEADMMAIAKKAQAASISGDTEEISKVGTTIYRIDRKQWFSQGVQFGARYSHSQGIAEIDHDETSAIRGIDVYVPSTDPGVRFPHFWRADGTSIFDQLGEEWSLLRVGASKSASDSIEVAFAKNGVSLTVLDVAEPDATEVYESPLVLVRPDMIVAWSGHRSPANSNALVSSLLGAESDSFVETNTAPESVHPHSTAL